MRALAWLLLAACCLGAPARAADLARGEYLTRAADCAACHTAPGGAAFAGGRGFKLPFGTLYSPNITPDRATGVADYTDDEWVSALRRGVGRHGIHLYPAMPYANYALLTRQDALDIRAWLATIPAVHQPNRANALRFPFDQRWGLVFWNLVNAPDRSFKPDAAHSAAWNRGAWLVEGPGHCNQCHTPRDWTYGFSSRRYAGAVQQGWQAWNLTSDDAHGIGGWTDASLAEYLSTGQAPGHGPASGPMAEAVGNSLRYLTPTDIAAIVAYLRTLPALTDGPTIAHAGLVPASAKPQAGGAVFAQACAGCHLPDGAGRQSAWAALAGAHSLGDPDGRNILAVLTEGSELQTAHDGTQFMHGFTGAFTDQELAETGNWLIGSFGGRSGAITAAKVQAARQKVP